MSIKTEVKTLKVQDIKPYWRNPKNIERSVEIVKKSIELYGYNQYIVVDTNGVIIAGHARYKALVELGYTEIKCIVTDLSPEKAREYRLVDNKSAEYSTWKTDDLILELREISDLGNIKTFFGDEDVEQMVRESTGYKIPNVEQEEIKKLEANEGSTFRDANKNEISEYLEVVCPECGNTFSVKREDVLHLRA